MKIAVFRHNEKFFASNLVHARADAAQGSALGWKNLPLTCTKKKNKIFIRFWTVNQPLVWNVTLKKGTARKTHFCEGFCFSAC